MACIVYEPGYAIGAPPAPADAPPVPRTLVLPPPLLAPVLPESAYVDRKVADAERAPAQRVWRVVPGVRRPRAPAWVVGSMVHDALAAWRFPDATFERWAAARARNYGLTDAEQIFYAVRKARTLLARFEQHPLHDEMARAGRRLNEVPYSLSVGGRVESGVIDAVYLQGDSWTVVEFKTDEIRDVAELDALLSHEDYLAQTERYATAVEQLLGHRPRVVLCLLDYKGKVFLHGIEDER